MDLRTKFVFALVGVSLTSMLALAFLSYGPARALWREGALASLDALAESKQGDIERVVEGWRDRVRLIGSRRQLRALTAEFDRTHSPEHRDAVVEILRDVRSAVPGLDITIYDTHQHPLATTLGGGEGPAPPFSAMQAAAVAGGVRVLDLRRGIDHLAVWLGAPLTVERGHVGTLVVRLSGSDLLDVTRDHTGLGETGETLIARLDDTSGVSYLIEPRDGLPTSRVTMSDRRDPMVMALRGVDSTFHEDVIDYQGAEVWAATRYLPEVGIGLVVKLDKTEQEAPLLELRATMTRMAIALSAFGILAGIIIGLRFAGPIHELADVAQKIQGGDFEVRAPVRSEDEIGLLATVFNQMTDRLLESNQELRREIQEHKDATPAPRTGTSESSDPEG